MREINHLSLHQWLRSAIPDSQQPMLFLKLPPPPCAVLLVIKHYNGKKPFVVHVIINTFVDRGFSIAMFDYRRYIGLTQFDS